MKKRRERERETEREREEEVLLSNGVFDFTGVPLFGLSSCNTDT